MERITVHLSRPVAPGDKAEVSGILQNLNHVGVKVWFQPYGEQGRDLFFPMHVIERIEYDGAAEGLNRELRDQLALVQGALDATRRERDAAKAERDLAALRARVEALAERHEHAYRTVAGRVEAQMHEEFADDLRALLPGGDDANPNSKET